MYFLISTNLLFQQITAITAFSNLLYLKSQWQFKDNQIKNVNFLMQQMKGFLKI